MLAADVLSTTADVLNAAAGATGEEALIAYYEKGGGDE